MSGTCNLTIEQGATWSITITWEVDGSPVDLTDYTARMQIRRKHDSDDALLDITDDDAITLGGVAGTIAILLSDDETAAIPAGLHVYDLELEASDGTVTRLLQGSCNVDAEVTR